LKFSWREISCILLNMISWIYLIILFTWLAAHLLTGDRIPILALSNFIAVYFFFPLPVVLLLGIFCRSRSLLIGFAIGAIAFLALWGHLFLPRLSQPRASGAALTVMTYNVLAWHSHTDEIIANIRAENPDLVLIQELNHTLANALKTGLAAEYPYQVLDPVDNPTGIGAISRYPLRDTGERMPLRWIGGPQILEMDWSDRRITVINIHMFSTTRIASASIIDPEFRLREAEARLLVERALQEGPAIVAGDANTSPLSEAYRILSRDLIDAWREAGFSLGHTFPGSDIPGSDRPRLRGWLVPKWLARIDYIFHSEHWVTKGARMARFDQVSDHRGVIAVLRLK
jgi:endonuclease/exonuclease/phosphatase (EEP) superfamily protein YafD